jgi:antitoxin component of MazEF toxin-antitoxin module
LARKQVGKNAGNSGRINVSGSELDQLGIEIGDAVDVEVADTEQIAHAIIDSKEASEFLIVTSN